MDKYIEILTSAVSRTYDSMDDVIYSYDIEGLAQELHALRYEVARQVWEEYQRYRVDCTRDGFETLSFDDWLADQGETITIGRDNK